jgi:hypothetical protein
LPPDKTHRAHAIVEQVHADLKNSGLAHLPSGMFTENAVWLVLAVMALNLIRADATLTGPTLAKSTTPTIAVPAHLESFARQIRLHLPTARPCQTAWTRPLTTVLGCGPPLRATT